MNVVILSSGGDTSQYDNIKRVTERSKDIIMMDTNGHIYTAKKTGIITIEITII